MLKKEVDLLKVERLYKLKRRKLVLEILPSNDFCGQIVMPVTPSVTILLLFLVLWSNSPYIFFLSLRESGIITSE